VSTILIIDDDDQLRISFERLLNEEGYAVRTAASGEAGIRMIDDAIPDLVLLDVRLPGINGLEAFKQIHRIESKLPVIIMTAFGTTETAIEATKMGAFDYVIKPFDVPQMLSTIRQALEAGRFMRSPVDMDASPDKIQGAKPSSVRVRPCRRFTRPSAGCRPPMPRCSSAVSPVRARNSPRGPSTSTAPARKTLSGDQLRGHSRHPAGKRVVRL
jgi:DNA-binding NtrC family response regulator